jgi:dihydroflavonol-4-reductase
LPQRIRIVKQRNGLDVRRRKHDVHCLVTGAGGFVGAALVRRLVNEGYKVRALLRSRETAFNLDRVEIEIYLGNILNFPVVKEAMENIDFVFHVASIYDGVPFYDSSPKVMYRVNVEGARNICQAALESGNVKRVIYTSSAGTVGFNDNGPLSDETIPLNYIGMRSHYEKSKKLAEDVVLSFHDKGLQTISINPSFIVGKGDFRPTPTGEMIIKFLNGRYPCYFDAKLPLANLSDVVDAHVACMKRGKSGERYIISSQEHITLKGLFNYMEELTGIKGPAIRLPLWFLKIIAIVNEALIGLMGMRGKVRPIIAYELTRYFGLGTFYDSTKAQKELGVTSKPIHSSIHESIAWYMQNSFVKKAACKKYEARQKALNSIRV